MQEFITVPDYHSLSQFSDTREGTCLTSWSLSKELIFNSWRVVTNLNPSGIVFKKKQDLISKWQRLGMAPSSTLHSSKKYNLWRRRYWSKGNPPLEQTISFPEKAIYIRKFLNESKRRRIFKLGNFSKVGIGSSSSWVPPKVNLARFGENLRASGSFFIR